MAVYAQIENQIQFYIAAERLQPGDSVPSIREMSVMLNVNQNTVAKAYRDLELMGLVNARRGVGVTVSDKAPRLCKSSVQKMVQDHLRNAVAECISAGLTPVDVRQIVTATIDSGSNPYQPS